MLTSIFKKYNFFIYINERLKQIYYKYLITDEKIIRKRFKQRLDREVNLEKPVKYNDKLQWLKLNWHDPLATKCADKYAVRDFIKKTIGEKYLNQLLGVYNSVDEIELDKLPKSFVLKGTHGSGFNIVCKDKNKMDWEKEYQKMKRWLRTNYYLSKREWVYKDIKPRIVCEKYLDDGTGKPPMDYKIFCFHGEPKLIQVDVDRFGKHRKNFYDLDWNYMDVEIEAQSDKTIKIQRPKTLDKMLNLSRALAEPFPHVRVDFYSLHNQIIFGELTFFHQSGMGKISPPEFDEELGSYLSLPINH